MPWTVLSQPSPAGNPLPKIPDPTPSGPMGMGPDPNAPAAPLQTTGGWVVADHPLTPLEIMRRSPDAQQAIQELARKRDVPWQQLQVQVAQRAASERKPVMQVIQEMGGSGTLPQTTQGPALPALPQAQRVQPPGPAFAPYVPASAGGQQPGVLQQLEQGDIFGASRQAISEAWQAGVVRPVVWGLGILGKPAELTEQALTGGKGYDQWLQAHGITNPTERFIFSTAAKVALDPTNIFMFPFAVEKGLSIGAKAAMGGYRLARATGVPEAAARSIGLIERGLLDNPMTGPGARLAEAGFKQIRTRAAAARDMAFSLFDKTYKMPPEFRDAYRAYQSRTIDVVQQGEQELKNIVSKVESSDDRRILYNAMRGTHDIEDLSPELRAEYDRLDKIRNDLTRLGIDQGFIEHTVENYIRRLFDPATMGEIEQIRRTGLAKEGLRGPLGKQILPGPGALGTTTRAGMKRLFLTDEAAEDAGKKVIQDVALSIPAHIWEFGFAHNTADFLRDMAELDEEWAAKQAGRVPLVMKVSAEAPADWVPFESLVGGPTARRTKLWAREGETGGPVVAVSPDIATATESSGRALSGERTLKDLRASPRLAEFVKDMTGVRGDVPDYMRLYGRVAGDVKRIVFWNAVVHGGNILRSVFLADGFKGFNPTRWMEMYRDGQEFGPWSRAYLKFGGTEGTSLESKMSSGLDEVMSAVGPAKQALQKAGINWQELRKAPLKIPGAIKALSDHLLWQGFDKTGRLQVFRDMAEGFGIHEADLANLTIEQQQKLAEATGLTNKFLNNYSRTAMTRFEKGLANIFFTYAWNKGRLQLFGDMARSFAPGTALSAAERAAYQQGAMRWAIANMVVPHFVRAMRAQASDGIWGAALPVGQQARGGYTNPLYMDYTGFYSDTQQFITHPITWAWARANPLVKSLFDLVSGAVDARSQGKSELEAAGEAVTKGLSDYVPAGLPQALAPGRPWYTRISPWFGLPVTTVPPRPEDPRIHMQEAAARGDYATVAAIIRQARLGLFYTTGKMPADERRKILQLDRLLFGGGGGGGGTGIGTGLDLNLGISSQDLLK